MKSAGISTKATATNAIGHLNVALAEKPAHFGKIYTQITLIYHLCRVDAPDILLAMLGQGMISSVVKTLLWLEKHSPSTRKDEKAACECLTSCFFLLIQPTMTRNGPSWVSKALDAGILLAIMKSAPRMQHMPDIAVSNCAALLSYNLCQYLVYKSVIRSAARAIKRVDHDPTLADSGGHIWEAWNVFKTLAEERIAFKDGKDELDTEEAERHSCNRAQCDARTNYHQLLRCSGCFEAFYCDKSCQRMDWPDHKPSCKKIQRYLRESAGTSIPTGAGESKLLFDIMSTEIHANKEPRGKLIAALSAAPAGCSPSEFAFSLDYTKVPVEISVFPVGEHPDPDEYWEQTIERALQSNGRLMAARALVQRGDGIKETLFTTPVPQKRD
ncbi:hypothetical protein FIBSPDRAFT_1043749 [Athelia psychrophila]|uniref:MYND-type domain-containing protein n=1 Tax=Athelia psychrophila TaxID=1759441 RepID=A0A166KLR8_9AGAM|nr:hypothetical protein FIBSPDRAFT_1043749 [Fibularhizoctonia sp. CBS 109695]